jgi:hypothetical protein
MRVERAKGGGTQLCKSCGNRFEEDVPILTYEFPTGQIGTWHVACIAEVLQPEIHEQLGLYRTRTGRWLTDLDLEELAIEAEAGYDIERLRAAPGRRSSVTAVTGPDADSTRSKSSDQ